MKKLFACAAAAACLLLSACGETSYRDPSQPGQGVWGEVHLIATAPDGTRLWQMGNQEIYFAASGTAFSYRAGKVTHHVDVPTVRNP